GPGRLERRRSRPAGQPPAPAERRHERARGRAGRIPAARLTGRRRGMTFWSIGYTLASGRAPARVEAGHEWTVDTVGVGWRDLPEGATQGETREHLCAPATLP